MHHTTTPVPPPFHQETRSSAPHPSPSAAFSAAHSPPTHCLRTLVFPSWLRPSLLLVPASAAFTPPLLPTQPRPQNKQDRCAM